MEDNNSRQAIAVTADNQLAAVATFSGKWRLPTVAEVKRSRCGVLQECLFETPEAFAAMRVEEILPPLQAISLRGAEEKLGHHRASLAARGVELLAWDSASCFCGTCGTKMERHTDISKLCPSCGREVFPQLTPAMVVLVKRGEEALLAQAKSFSHPVFALVAGFVETGETLEECVAREVMEETGLRITNVRYYGSQSWPFPSNLMLAFTAECAEGEISLNDGELREARFFSREEPVDLPRKGSLSRRLIDAWRSGEV